MREEKITFAQWCKEKGIFEPLEKWDNNKNETSPDSIAQWDTNKYWFKCCNNPEHESRLIKPGTIRKSNNITNVLKCKECASFYQWCKDNDEQVLLDSFDYERNGDIDLKVLGAQSNKKYWFKCPRGIHGSYERTISVLTRKNKTTYNCPACSSIGQYIIDEYGEDGYDKIISDKNEIDPFTVLCNSDVKLWFKCTENKNHPDYYHEAKVHHKGVGCPKCAEETMESKLESKVKSYCIELGYNINTERACSIVPINYKTGHTLPFDNEIIINSDNLIIEVHGVQHYKVTTWCINNAKKKEITPEEELEHRINLDKYKKDYAISHGYYYLEIPYWTEKDEKYKKLIDDKIEEILSKQSNQKISQNN